MTNRRRVLAGILYPLHGRLAMRCVTGRAGAAGHAALWVVRRMIYWMERPDSDAWLLPLEARVEALERFEREVREACAQYGVEGTEPRRVERTDDPADVN